ncbi:MAG: 30S ribosomal protein S4, partial [Nitrosopumilus sp.]
TVGEEDGIHFTPESKIPEMLEKTKSEPEAVETPAEAVETPAEAVEKPAEATSKDEGSSTELSKK